MRIAKSGERLNNLAKIFIPKVVKCTLKLKRKATATKSLCTINRVINTTLTTHNYDYVLCKIQANIQRQRG